MPDQSDRSEPIDAEIVTDDDTEPTGPAGTPAPGGAPVPSPLPVDTGYTADGVPTFESVRDRIETRFGTALGSTELAAETPEGRAVEEQYEKRQQAAAERLQQIRDSMRGTGSDHS